MRRTPVLNSDVDTPRHILERSAEASLGWLADTATRSRFRRKLKLFLQLIRIVARFYRGFWRYSGGFGRFRAVSGGFGRFRAVSGGFGRFRAVSEELKNRGKRRDFANRAGSCPQDGIVLLAPGAKLTGLILTGRFLRELSSCCHKPRKIIDIRVKSSNRL